MKSREKFENNYKTMEEEYRKEFRIAEEKDRERGLAIHWICKIVSDWGLCFTSKKHRNEQYGLKHKFLPILTELFKEPAQHQIANKYHDFLADINMLINSIPSENIFISEKDIRDFSKIVWTGLNWSDAVRQIFRKYFVDFRHTEYDCWYTITGFDVEYKKGIGYKEKKILIDYFRDVTYDNKIKVTKLRSAWEERNRQPFIIKEFYKEDDIKLSKILFLGRNKNVFSEEEIGFFAAGGGITKANMEKLLNKYNYYK